MGGGGGEWKGKGEDRRGSERGRRGVGGGGGE